RFARDSAPNARACGVCEWKVRSADRQLATRLVPVVDERGLHRRHRRATDAHVTVAPMVGTVRVAVPLVSNPHPAGVGDLAIDHEELSMCSMIVPHPVVPADAAEPGDV